jgi:DNA repair exonuclease SbcCD ATPase subunit
VKFKFKKFRLFNILNYKNLDRDLNDLGIVLIEGKNGVGKSTMWGMLEAIFFGSTPLGAKTDELVRNDKDARAELDVEVNDIPYTIINKRVKGKWSYDIVTDHPEPEFRKKHTVNETIKVIRSMIPHTREEFNGAVHLAQGTQHILIDGKPAARKQYVSDYFGVDDRYDIVFEEAKTEKESVEKQIEKIASYSHSITMLEDDLKNYPEVDTTNMENSHRQFLVLKRGYDEKIQQLNAEKRNCQLFNELIPEASKYSGHQSLLDNNGGKLIQAKTSIAQNNQATEHNKRARQQNAYRETLTEQLKSFADLDGLNWQNVRDESYRLKTLIDTYTKTKSLIEQLQTLPTGEIKPTATIETELKRVNGELYSLKSKLKSIESGQCPTCGRECEAGHIGELKATIDELELQATDYNETLAVLTTKNEKIKTRMLLEKQLGDFVVPTNDDYAVMQSLETTAKRISQYEELNKQIAKYPAVEYLSESDVSALQIEVQYLELEMSKIQNSFDAFKKLPIGNHREVEQIDVELAAVTEERNKTDSKIQSISEELGAAKTQNERSAGIKEQLNKIKTMAAELPSLKRKELYWTKVAEAYGPRGLRVRQLEKIMGTVMRRLPLYFNLMFNNKQFSIFHKCDAGNIEIFMRKETKSEGIVEHDISYCSGAEKRKLSVAFLLALADCRTALKRTNILILDEVDGALDAEGRWMFVNNLLPMLKEQYESVFVISHSEDIQQAAVFDQVWKITADENFWAQVTVSDTKYIN